MTPQFQSHSKKIVYKVHLASPPAKVYKHLASNKGRSLWWAISAVEKEDHIDFKFDNGISCRGKVTAKIVNRKFAVIYFGRVVTFDLKSDGKKGTDMTMSHAVEIDDPDRRETEAGWVSALLTLKAAVDFGIDLRNHDAKRSWLYGYCDN